ncbi:F-box domain protein [Talaromyces stipitatus ATCC 10500]|uniref:F-box domain protein n=1 Tax=Talaromyces stipitatus (strain ATCC 10500 / CBS 375.48 / QM 6759 / NRRL 1006) TaxID=441959 RepID=B8MGV5_TALSN|nr:F-box domain protein [Talaromyces stipitatus ATCC 10500]EED16336.1 F-box domain protein [Talaromyces stipitatus ATCC 10500]
MGQLTDLPDELLHDVLSLLPAVDLVSVSATCRTLYRLSQDEKLWQRLVNANIPHKIDKPGVFDTFRDLYSAHHPYWFLPRNKIWFSDGEYTGTLIISRYDNRRGVVEAFRLVAEYREETAVPWRSHPDVEIQPFNPRLRLWLDDPVIELRNPKLLHFRDRQYSPDQFRMTMVGQNTRVCSSFSLCRGNLGNAPKIKNDLLWPPVTIPGERSARRHHEHLVDEKSNTYQQIQKLCQDPERISETSFYLRKWLHFGVGQPVIPRQPVDQTYIFATLDPALYTPTKDKPFQGIWVGDYNFHKCEFLLFLQRDPGEPAPLLNNARRHLRAMIGGARIFEETNNDDNDDGIEEEEQEVALLNGRFEDAFERASPPVTQPSDEVEEFNGTRFQGRLEGIKLTGDPNIPRGEISFVAEDIGPRGLIGVSQDGEFRGARVVQSKGHIAFQHYTDDQWVNTQLFLISPDYVAQYWEPMRHISFFRRVDIDQFTKI